MMNQQDLDVLRSLAEQIVETASSPVMSSRRKAWYRMNALQSEQPMVLVSPEGAWKEIRELTPIQCSDPVACEFEWQLRQRLRQASFEDDMPVEADFVLGYEIEPDTWGVKIERRHSGMEGGAYKPIPPLTDLSRDLAKLHFRTLRWKKNVYEQKKEMAEKAFGDLLKIVPAPGYCFWTCGMTCNVIDLIGMEELMIGMYDQPENIHALMQFLTEDLEQYLDQLERENLLWYNNGSNLVGSGHCGLTDELPSAEHPVGNVTTAALWGLAESQETVGISPEMFAEFIWPYQKRLLQRFGLAYYGCCEPVNERLASIREAGNLRAISVSPWADVEQCARELQKQYVLCHKVNPSYICLNFNEKEIRRELRSRLDICKGLNNVFVLKDTHTVHHEPERFNRWVEIVREEFRA